VHTTHFRDCEKKKKKKKKEEEKPKQQQQPMEGSDSSYYGQSLNLGGEFKKLLDDLKVGSKEEVTVKKGFSTKSDVFSYSIVLWEMATRCFMGEYKTPYYADNKSLRIDAAILIQVAKKGLRPNIRPEIPASLSTLIQWCWNAEPNRRPSCLTILQQLQHIEQEYNQNKFRWNKCYVFNTNTNSNTTAAATTTKKAS